MAKQLSITHFFMRRITDKTTNVPRMVPVKSHFNFLGRFKVPAPPKPLSPPRIKAPAPYKPPKPFKFK